MVNAVTAWVPGVILVGLLGHLSVGPAIVSYTLGFAAFISIYEIGYLVNDTYGLRHDPTPRLRTDFPLSFTFVATFTAIRLLRFSGRHLGTWYFNQRHILGCDHSAYRHVDRP